MDLNFLVGNRREITFVLQARPPRAPCDAYEQDAKYESAYMHARAARTVCMIWGLLFERVVSAQHDPSR